MKKFLSMLGDYVDYLIANSSAEAPMWNIEKVRSGKPNKWNYIDGCMITACLSLYKTTGDEKYLRLFQETSSTGLCRRTAPSRPTTPRSTTWTT